MSIERVGFTIYSQKQECRTSYQLEKKLALALLLLECSDLLSLIKKIVLQEGKEKKKKRKTEEKKKRRKEIRLTLKEIDGRIERDQKVVVLAC